MAAFTSITVTSTTVTPIIATVYGNRIQVQEDVAVTNWPSTNFTIFKINQIGGGPSSQGKQVTAGAPYDFFKGVTVSQPFHPGDIIGYIKTLTGTTVFIVDESGA